MRHSLPNSLRNPDALPSEDELVARLTRGLPQSARTLTGAGDDCAVVRIPGASLLQLFKADAVVEGIHFTRSMPPDLIGRKALGRAVSDIASMGGAPCEGLVTLVLPPDVSMSWVLKLYAGLKRAAKLWGVGLAGGETSSAPPGSPVVVSIALTGEVREDRLVHRSGARPGDRIAVTGWLGNSFGSGWHLQFQPRLEAAQWLAEFFRPTAMMDLSDGLAKDLPRLAAASGVGWDVECTSLPVRPGATVAQAVGEGEDYELLATFPQESWPELATAWRNRFPRLPLTQIGQIAAHRVRRPKLSGGWDHFGPTPAEAGGK